MYYFSVLLYSSQWRISWVFPREKGTSSRGSHLFLSICNGYGYFGKGFRCCVRASQFRPHPLCITLLVTHLSFADDVLIFFGGSESSLDGIMTVLHQLYIASGLQLSLLKSQLFLDGNNIHLVQSLATDFGISQGSLPVRYLGLPLLPHKMRPSDYQPLIEKG